MISLSTLGGLAIYVADNGSRIPLSPQEGELFAFVMASDVHCVRKTKIFSNFWPDRPERDARQFLNASICEIRKKMKSFKARAFSYELEVTRDEVRFTGEVQMDSLVFSQVIKAFVSGVESVTTDPCDAPDLSDAICVLSSYKGAFLDGYESDWISPERTRLEDLYCQGHRLCTRIFVRQGRIERAVESTRHILQVDPFHEGAHCDLIRLLALNGQRAAALRHYNLYSDVLNEELGIKPLEEASNLREKILTGRVYADFDMEMQKVGENLNS